MAHKLSESDVRQHLASVPGWAIQDGELSRTFELASFPAALMFVSAVGYLAEAAGHHPDIVIKYRNVKLSLVTHDAGGLTEKDFALASQINALPKG
jgi:4a-hydroxytetrahydrobiopterin dehydratase